MKYAIRVWTTNVAFIHFRLVRPNVPKLVTFILKQRRPNVYAIPAPVKKLRKLPIRKVTVIPVGPKAGGRVVRPGVVPIAVIPVKRVEVPRTVREITLCEYGGMRCNRSSQNLRGRSDVGRQSDGSKAVWLTISSNIV